MLEVDEARGIKTECRAAGPAVKNLDLVLGIQAIRAWNLGVKAFDVDLVRLLVFPEWNVGEMCQADLHVSGSLRSMHDGERIGPWRFCW